MELKLKISYLVILVLVAFILVTKSCEQEPKTIVKTKIEYVQKIDTITKTIIEPKEKTVYVEKIITLKGKDSLIYVDKSSNTTIIAKEYGTKLESNGANADLKITTTGKLLNVTGTIVYPEKTITNKVIAYKAKSGLFLYGETSVQPTLNRFELGLDYQFKNTIIVGSSIDYNTTSNNLGVNVKLGFKIF